MSHIRLDLEIDDRSHQSVIEPPPRPTPWRRIAAHLTERAERRAARLALAGLDGRALRDIGLCRAMVDFELSQPSARPIVDRRR